MHHPFNRRFSRRNVLAGLGVTAAAAPFLPLLRSAKANGEEQAPRRFIVFFHPHGTVRENWLPTGTEHDFQLSEILMPLADFQDRMLVIDGLNVVPSGPPGGPHTVGPAYVHTGSPMLEGDEFMHMSSGGPHGWASSASIDQVIAQAIGGGCPFPSLEFGMQTGGLHPGSRISYTDADEPMTPEPNPHVMFDRVFGDPTLDTETAAKIKAERLSIIDIIEPELESLAPRVSAEDRYKIEAHLDGIRQVEQALSAEYACEAPDIGDPIALNDWENTPHISRRQLDIMVDSLACGATNVASIMYRRGENDALPYPHLGLDHEHHLTTHAGDSDEVAKAEITSVYRWYAEELAYLCGRLDAIEDPEGGTMLDNTVILWTTEIAKGNNHSWDQMPFVVMGGGGGRLDTGRFVQYGGVNHCALLVALCQAFDLEVESFGGFDDGSGALPGILV